MNDDEKFLAPEMSLPKSGGATALRLAVTIAAIILLIGGAGAATLWLQQHGIIMPLPANGSAASTPGTEELERKVRALDARVSELAGRVDEVAASASTPQGENPATPKTSDLSRVQSDLTALAATVGSLQSDMKQAGSIASGMRGEAVAFLQLRDAAASGHGFTHELNNMRTAAKADAAFQEELDKLNSYAEKGTASLSTLRHELATRAVAADQAIAKAGAQSWWERVVAELKGLISVRPLHGSGTVDASLDTMQSDLARGDVAAALDELKNLPAPAQTPLEEWRQRAEARRIVDDAMRTLADRLIAGSSEKPATQDAP